MKPTQPHSPKTTGKIRFEQPCVKTHFTNDEKEILGKLVVVVIGICVLKKLVDAL